MSPILMDQNRSALPAGAAYHETLAASWAAGYVRSGFRRRLALFDEIMARNVVAGQRWLDLGCGSGVLTRQLLKLGARVTAVDASPAMLRSAADYLGEDADKVTWLQSDVTAVDLSEHGQFDGLLCSSVIEYVNEPHTLMSSMARALAPGGVLVLSLPPKFSVVRTVQKSLRVAASTFGYDLYRYLSVSRFEVDPGLLHEWFGRHEFELLRMVRFDPILPAALLSLVRPSLLVCEAQVVKNGMRI